MAGRLAEKLLLRRSSVYSTPENPADTLKYVYGDLTSGDQGVVPLVVIQKWNGSSMVYQIADHPIYDEQPTVFVNDIEDTTGSFTFSAANNFQAKGTVATLTSSVDHTGKQVSVRCKGKLNSLGDLIKNPAEQVYDLIYVTYGITDEFNLDAYIEAADIAAEIGLETGGVVIADNDPVVLADDILEPYGGALVDYNGKLYIFIEGLPENPNVVDDIEEVFIDGFLYELYADQIVNDVKMQYAFNWRKAIFQTNAAPWDGLALGEDVTSQLEYKRRTTPETLKAPWIRTPAAATLVVDTILALWRAPRPQITLTIPSTRAALTQVSDIVTFSHRKYPGGNQPGGPGDRRLIRVRQTMIDPVSNTGKIVGSDIGRILRRRSLDEEITMSEDLTMEIVQQDMIAAWVFDSNNAGRVPNLWNPGDPDDDAVMSGASSTDDGYLRCGAWFSTGAAVEAVNSSLKPQTWTIMAKCIFLGDAGYAGGFLGVNNHRSIMYEHYDDGNYASFIGSPHLGTFGGDLAAQKSIKFSIKFSEHTEAAVFSNADYENATPFVFTLTYDHVLREARGYIDNTLVWTEPEVFGDYLPGQRIVFGYDPFVPGFYSNVGIYFGYKWKKVLSPSEIAAVIADPTSVLPPP